ncbi:mannose-1-phosphate guanylyltransferase [Paraglaciecola psychrophila 170]|uniref:Mannose-1-phosphate guanylyltransferase n=1 Tax=Paraglaciecola psychrophila 170 TaxID=1129794 RepID=M4RZ40_9ALTE|nr:mannose-1-phosphate guanylyltransferase [Paraglaciecola psychrophila 170]
MTNRDKTFLLSGNESTCIPLGQIHALENPGVLLLEVIEAQTGSYLGKDYIVRLDDFYAEFKDIVCKSKLIADDYC